MKRILRRSSLANFVYAKLFRKEVPASDVLSKLINENNFHHYVEVGVWKGITMKRILKLCPKLKMAVGVDPYIAITDGDISHIYEESQKYFDFVYNVTKKYIGDERFIQVRAKSADAAINFIDGSIDIVFIDAMHTYDCVKQDIEAWYPKIKQGGIIAGHDFSHRFPGIVKAVLERFGHNINLAEDKVWWIKKT